MTEFDEKRKEVEAVGHSSFMCQTVEGYIITSIGDICYADIFYEYNTINRIVLFLPNHSAYVEWLTKKSGCADVFVNKGEDGIKNGFELDLTQPFFLVKAAMISIRLQEEFGENWWPWERLVQEGFSAEQAMLLCSYVRYTGSWERKTHYEAGHSAFPRYASPSNYNFDIFKRGCSWLEKDDYEDYCSDMVRQAEMQKNWFNGREVPLSDMENLLKELTR